MFNTRHFLVLTCVSCLYTASSAWAFETVSDKAPSDVSDVSGKSDASDKDNGVTDRRITDKRTHDLAVDKVRDHPPIRDTYPKDKPIGHPHAHGPLTDRPLRDKVRDGKPHAFNDGRITDRPFHLAQADHDSPKPGPGAIMEKMENLTPEQREKMKKIHDLRQERREKWENATPEEREKMKQIHEARQDRREDRRDKIENATPEEREKMKQIHEARQDRREDRREKIENASPQERQAMREKIRKNRIQRAERRVRSDH